MGSAVKSENFGFLGDYDAQLGRLGALAERYFRDDPNTCLIKLRQFGKLLAQQIAARAGVFTATEESQADLLRRLKIERLIPSEVADLFHQLRLAGNQATPGQASAHREALTGRENREPSAGRMTGQWVSLTLYPPQPVYFDIPPGRVIGNLKETPESSARCLRSWLADSGFSPAR